MQVRVSSDNETFRRKSRKALMKTDVGMACESAREHKFVSRRFNDVLSPDYLARRCKCLYGEQNLLNTGTICEHDPPHLGMKRPKNEAE